METNMATKHEPDRRAPNVPTTMLAAAIDRFGPPEAITPRTLPVPEPGPKEVLIELHTAGVGSWDADIRRGEGGTTNHRFPYVLGTDGAGVVVARGTSEEHLRLGERVWAYEYDNPKGGFYAEYVAVSSEHVGRVPTSLDLHQAGAATVTALTAVQGVDDHLSVKQKECVLIFGASGAVGTLAVQFAKRRTTHVIGTASGPGATDLVRQLGAEHVIDPRSDDAVERLRTIAPKGLDAVLALAGGEALERLLDLMRPEGRVSYPNGVTPEPKRRPGITYRANYDAVAGRREYERLAAAVDEVRLSVPIAAELPLAQAAQAHVRLEQGHVLGRIALRIKR
jgi:NADPH2:quinone reductase